MLVETDADALRLQTALRDIVALSAIPATWIGREPAAVASGLADSLVALLQLDFAFVRLSYPDGDGAVDVRRGNAWSRFSEWLERHATRAQLPGKAIVADVGDSDPCRGVAIPVGVNGDGGLVAAASSRGDFPTAIDQLLLSLAANHAATAFQNACLIDERRRAEEEVRATRDELEVKVAERTTELRRLADAQAALRRVATFVARAAPPAEVFEAVSAEVGRLIPAGAAALARYETDGTATLLGAWERSGRFPLRVGDRFSTDEGTLARAVLDTGRPARVSDYADAPDKIVDCALPAGWRSCVAAPIIVEGGLWGFMTVASTTERPLRPDTEQRLAEFTELVATAIANYKSRADLAASEARARELANEQAALRRVATLVAQGGSPNQLFSAVAKEVAHVIDIPTVSINRYEADETLTILGNAGETSDWIGTRWPVGDERIEGMILATGRPARQDDFKATPPEFGDPVRDALTQSWQETRSVIGVPIIVEGSLWGFMSLAARPGDPPIPAGTEERLARFTDLVATAIANAESRSELTLLAEEQAALRRVATLVAEGAGPNDVFAAVADEVAAMFGVPITTLFRFDADDMATMLATAGTNVVAAGLRFPFENSSLLRKVFETGSSAHIDDWTDVSGPGAELARLEGVRRSVAVPIVVDNTLWGMMALGARDDRSLSPDVEPRLAKFTELLATAIANSQAREQLAELAEEQAALRRVATLVAEGATPDRVFDAVLDEVARMFDAPLSALTRYDGEGIATVVATDDEHLGPVGRTWSVEADDSAIAQVCRTGRPARVDYTGSTAERVSDVAQRTLARSAVGVPVVVDAAPWGVMAVGSRGTEPLPADAENRLGKLTELLATAIANAQSRAELDASRARIVATADATRRRIERDLHDGAQQQLVWLALALRAAQATVPEELQQHQAELGRVVDGLTATIDDLREIALGIHPAGLSEDGLTPALKRLVARSPLRVNLDVSAARRFPEPVEVAAYYVVSESLTNAAKYAEVTVVDVSVAVDGEALRVEVRDDGRGGADPAEGSGLVGLKDRVEAIGGTMRLTSPPGTGTSLSVALPMRGEAARS